MVAPGAEALRRQEGAEPHLGEATSSASHSHSVVVTEKASAAPLKHYEKQQAGCNRSGRRAPS